jgi:hypothetical protein
LVYPRRAEHNTVAKGGNRGWADHHRLQPNQALAMLVGLVLVAYDPSGSVAAIASKAASVIEMRIMGII